VVPVLGGFIASDGKGNATTLGRGGSDFTAAIVGAALGANRVEIWTDVDAIRTTDPRLYPETQYIDVLSFQEAEELAHFGAKVLHLATLLPALEKNIPVFVLNSRNVKHPGTQVRAESDGEPRVKAIAVKRGITLLEASTQRSLRRASLASDIFITLEKLGCVPDVASVSDTTVLLSLDRAELVPRVCSALGPYIQVHTEASKVLISLVAENIREVPGLSADVFAALEGITVELIGQGSSRRSLSLVINESDAVEAVKRLHVAVVNNREELAFVAD